MTTEELIEKLGWIQNFKCETPTLEIKRLLFKGMHSPL